MVEFRPVAFLDSPEVLNAAITPIPASSSSPLEVVSDLGYKASLAIDYIDTTGDFIGVYLGVSGHETLTCIIGGGLNSRAYSVIAAHSRVSLRSMENTSITAGLLTCTFMGY